MSFCTKLLCPSKGTGFVSARYLQLLLPEHCKLNLGLRFGNCTGLESAPDAWVKADFRAQHFFFLFRCKLRAVCGALSPCSSSKGTDFFVSLLFVPSLGFYF